MQHLSSLVCASNVLSGHLLGAFSIDGAGADQLLSKEDCKIDHSFFGLGGGLDSVLFDEFVDYFDVALHKNYLSLMIQIVLRQC